MKIRIYPFGKNIRILSLCLGFLFLSASLSAQTPFSYVVVLRDKDTLTCSLSQPERFLSPRALEKRKRFQIPLLYEDLPLNPKYVDTIARCCAGFRVLTQSKWFNYVVIGTADTSSRGDSVLAGLRRIPWVQGVWALQDIPDSLYARWSGPAVAEISLLGGSAVPADSPACDTLSLDYWGQAAPQLASLNGQFLHRNRYTGRGMLIALLDNGYHKVDSLHFFDAFRQNGHIKGIFDATGQAAGLFDAGDHGMYVLSIMALNDPYRYVGSAPDADYVLLRTEVDSCEDLLEEFFWVAGAEYADSLGVDVVSSSLGYTTFDREEQNHDYSDLDGKHSVASLSAEKLTRKACVVNIAAGNEGKRSWHYISIPSDAPSALCVAAMNTDTVIAAFSSRGDSLWMKPDITSIGWLTAYCTLDDTISHGNGTSFATPLNAGLTACLWQAFPQKSCCEVMQAIRQSAHLYLAWNEAFGYGVPDYERAFRLLSGEESVRESEYVPRFRVYPNPVRDEVCMEMSGEVSCPVKYALFDSQGRQLKSGEIRSSFLKVDVKDCPAGTYFLRFSSKGVFEAHAFVRY